MADWLKSMQQTFEYYIVDPRTWKDTSQLRTVKSCTNSRDSTADTLGSATLDVSESLGESYIRAYLITVQNGVTNSDIVSAIKDLKDNMPTTGNTSYNINGITYDDGSNIVNAVETLVRAARIERRI